MVHFFPVHQLCLCILILTSGTSVSYAHTVILGVGVVWACFTAASGAIAVSVFALYNFLYACMYVIQ